MPQRKGNFVTEVLRKGDLLGKPVELSVRSHSTFKTAFGGCVTATIMLILFVYGVIYTTEDLVLSPYTYTVVNEKLSFKQENLNRKNPHYQTRFIEAIGVSDRDHVTQPLDPRIATLRIEQTIQEANRLGSS